MTQLGKRMLEELERCNYSQGTARAYICGLKQFAQNFVAHPTNSALSTFASSRCT
ncbi:MAG: hypothetical protein ACRD7E_12500 [Bryobacteraceae bacterium]